MADKSEKRAPATKREDVAKSVMPKVDPKSAAAKSEAKPDKSEPKPLLEAGKVVRSETGNSYIVEKMLGKGGFGEVYKVYRHTDPDKKYAMKAERNAEKNETHATMLRLKVEIAVFDAMNKADPARVNKNYFIKMLDKGKTETFKYYVMELIWTSLMDYCKDIAKWVFSPNTLIQIGRQSLKGIEAMHEVGFLHRDIKPHNFAIGLPPRDDTLFILDYGIARPFRDAAGKIRPARQKVPYLGTERYASYRCQECQDQGRRDDMEVWMYMMLELYDKDNLYWRRILARKEIVKAKKELQGNYDKMFKDKKLKMPQQYCTIIGIIKDMKYEEGGDFTRLQAVLDQIVKTDKIDESQPLDWIGKAPKEQPSSDTPKKSSENAQDAVSPAGEPQSVRRVSVRRKRGKEDEKEDGEDNEDDNSPEADLGKSIKEKASVRKMRSKVKPEQSSREPKSKHPTRPRVKKTAASGMAASKMNEAKDISVKGKPRKKEDPQKPLAIKTKAEAVPVK